MDLEHVLDTAHVAHLETARKVLSLPIEVSGLHWHPFGIFAIPLAKRRDGATTYSRRLHIWHPAGRPVGPFSPYGVHTHTGDAQSHVLVGSLQHHLYRFDADPDGIWRECAPGHERMATLRAHAEAETPAGMTHRFPAHHAHGVGANGFSISLFEQAGGDKAAPFTTWQRSDGPAEPLVRTPPVAVAQVQQEALLAVEQALYLTA